MRAAADGAVLCAGCGQGPLLNRRLLAELQFPPGRIVFLQIAEDAQISITFKQCQHAPRGYRAASVYKQHAKADHACIYQRA